MKYIEKRILLPLRLRTLCCERNWYTKGTNEEYEKLLSSLVDSDGRAFHMTTEKLAEIAADIIEHSNMPDYTMTAAMFELARECYTYFEEVK